MKVLKQHSTPLRRLLPGDNVTAADIDGPLTVEALIELGVLEPDTPAKAKPKTEGDKK